MPCPLTPVSYVETARTNNNPNNISIIAQISCDGHADLYKETNANIKKNLTIQERTNVFNLERFLNNKKKN